MPVIDPIVTTLRVLCYDHNIANQCGFIVHTDCKENSYLLTSVLFIGKTGLAIPTRRPQNHGTKAL